MSASKLVAHMGDDEDFKSWMNPNAIPPWMYLLIVILGGGGALGGVNMMGDTGKVSEHDIARVEKKVDGLDSKVDELSTLMTDIRIEIARFHANKLE